MDIIGGAVVCLVIINPRGESERVGEELAGGG